MEKDEAVKELEEFLRGEPGAPDDAIRTLRAENERLLHLATTEENRARDAEEEIERLRAIVKNYTSVSGPHRFLQDEIERLRAALAEAVHANSTKEIRIEAALALCDSVDRPGGDRLVTIESVRKALKGGEE